MRYIVLTLTILLYLFSNGVATPQKEFREAQVLLNKVDSAIASLRTMQLKVSMYARMRGDDYKQLSVFKIQRSPLKIYYKQFVGNNIELLYDATVDKHKALVNPDGFPYTSIKLSPTSTRILERQHHSVFEADPQFILKQIQLVCTKDIQFCEASVSDTLVKGHKYHKVKLVDKQYKLESLQIVRKTTLIDLSKLHGVNYYSLVWFNKDLDVDSELKPGDIVTIPSSYAKSFILLIHPTEFTLRYVEVIDKNGVFEWFEYLEFKRNVTFSLDDFSSNNPNYNF